MAESYLFNPTESINKASNQMQVNLGNIFTGIIAQKQNDYNLAEKTFENINALTDKLGEYGQEEITSKTTSLLDDAARSIIKNGKLDYSEVGRIRNGVSTIKNRKSAIEAGTQMYKELAQTALATKDDLLNLGVTLDGMRSVILNPENLSAEDMGRQMQAVYQKNINTSKVFNDTASRIAPTQTYEQTYIKDGANYGVAGKKVGDYVLDPITGKFTAPAQVQAKNADNTPAINPDGTPKMISYSSQKFNDFMQAGGATVLDAIRKQLGENSVFQSNEQLFESRFQNYVQGNNTVQKNVQLDSANKIKGEAQQVELGEKQLKNFDIKAEDESNLTRANIRRINVATNKDLKEMELMQGGTDGSVNIDKENNIKTGFIGKKIPLSAKGSDGKIINMAALSIEWANGKEYYVGYQLPKDMTYIELAQTQLTGMPEVRVPVNAYNKTQFNTVLRVGVAKGDRGAIRKSISQYENTPMEIQYVAQPIVNASGEHVFSISDYRKDPKYSSWTSQQLTEAATAYSKAKKVKVKVIK